MNAHSPAHSPPIKLPKHAQAGTKMLNTFLAVTIVTLAIRTLTITMAMTPVYALGTTMTSILTAMFDR